MEGLYIPILMIFRDHAMRREGGHSTDSPWIYETQGCLINVVKGAG